MSVTKRRHCKSGPRLLGKAHLQQAVGLVQHERLQVLQAHRLRVAQVIDQAPLRPSAPFSMMPH